MMIVGGAVSKSGMRTRRQPNLVYLCLLLVVQSSATHRSFVIFCNSTSAIPHPGHFFIPSLPFAVSQIEGLRVVNMIGHRTTPFPSPPM